MTVETSMLLLIHSTLLLGVIVNTIMVYNTQRTLDITTALLEARNKNPDQNGWETR